MRRIIIVACVVAAGVAAVILVGAGRAPKPVSLHADTGEYHVFLDLDGASLGRRTATIEVVSEDGRPVAPADIDIRASMQTMRMTTPQLPARQIAPGRYEASGELFTMLGDWMVIVRISEPGSKSPQEAVFTVTAVP
jgi:hypothetical protein